MRLAHSAPPAAAPACCPGVAQASPPARHRALGPGRAWPTSRAPSASVRTHGLGNFNTPFTNSARDGSEALARSDWPKFVQFFRHASPYIAGHRNRTFVIVIPGNVAENEALLRSTMSDIAQLHGLGVRLVLVIGAQPLIDTLLWQRGVAPAYVGGYRITDQEALKAAVEAAGHVRITCEQFLSKGPAIPMIRRHTKGSGQEEIHYEPALRVVSGNYVTAKRRGIVDGVDFGYTGEVRFVLKDDIHRQLENHNLVLLSNLGFTAGGEVLNCNTFEVGLHAALELGADKLFNMHMDEVSDLNLPQWLPLSDAQDMLIKRLQENLSSEDLDTVRASMGAPEEAAEGSSSSSGSDGSGSDSSGSGSSGSGSSGSSSSSSDDGSASASAQEGSGRHHHHSNATTTTSNSSSGSGSSSSSSSSTTTTSVGQGAGGGAGQAARAVPDLKAVSPGFVRSVRRAHASKIKHSLDNNRHKEILMDLDVWSVSGYPAAVSSSVIACCKGVKRAHLLDARIDGGLLLELYSRDGVGTMISADFYEGIRKAGPGDLDAIAGLLQPLQEAGVLVSRSKEDLANMLQDFTVIERETKVMGCALLLPLGQTEDGVEVAEVGAFCVDPAFRGSGRGDSLLDYVEQEARSRGINRLVLLTTRTADWFEQRDFRLQGPASTSPLLPEHRRARINPSRNSQLYAKQMERPDDTAKPPGKRIGF